MSTRHALADAPINHRKSLSEHAVPVVAGRLPGGPVSQSAPTWAALTAQRLAGMDLAHSDSVVRIIEELLAVARLAGGSDLHLVPTEQAVEVTCRVDGVLIPLATLPRCIAANLIARLKVLAELLTYKTEVPQEGRIRPPAAPQATDLTAAGELRVSTFPTLFGEKAVVRMFAATTRFPQLVDLGLPDDIVDRLQAALLETSGAVVITGPAGSGKTTTAYACLREIQRQSGQTKSIVTLEDPVEKVLSGITQSQVRPAAGFDYALGLRSLMRQDPDVIFVGEIRDRETAETVFQASLTGHLVLSTFHAGSTCEAVSRLYEMGIEPYLIRTGLRCLIGQRLVRQLCDCAAWSDQPDDQLGLQLTRVRVPVGCSECHGTGYRHRTPLAECLEPQQRELGQAILGRADAAELQSLAREHGFRAMVDRAAAWLVSGQSSPAEIRRVLGFGSELAIAAARVRQQKEQS